MTPLEMLADDDWRQGIVDARLTEAMAAEHAANNDRLFAMWGHREFEVCAFLLRMTDEVFGALLRQVAPGVAVVAFDPPDEWWVRCGDVDVAVFSDEADAERVVAQYGLNAAVQP